MDLNRSHDRRVNRNDYHLPQQNPKRVRFVEVQNMPKPDFIVVFNHLYMCSGFEASLTKKRNFNR